MRCEAMRCDAMQDDMNNNLVSVAYSVWRRCEISKLEFSCHMVGDVMNSEKPEKPDQTCDIVAGRNTQTDNIREDRVSGN